MKIEEIENLKLSEMKLVAKDLGIKGFSNFKTKTAIMDKITEEVNALGLEEVPDPVPEVVEPEVLATTVVKPNPKKRIKDYPRKKVVISCRDDKVKDHPFSVNEYLALVKMEEEVNLPVPVIDFIKSVTQVKFEKDSEGNPTSREVNKFFVNYV